MQRQKPPKEMPLTAEGLKVLKELNEEFPADKSEFEPRERPPLDPPMPPPNIVYKEGRHPWKEYEKAITHRRDRSMVGGVFSFIADKFELDDISLWMLRIVGVTATLAIGYPILLYLIAWVIKPKE